jgi:GT2 family glycosyltransferase
MSNITIAIPHTGTLYSDVALSLLHINSMHKVSVQMLKSSILYISREKLVEAALKAKTDYILFFDSDQILQPDTIDRMAAHLENGEDIVTTLIFRKDPPFHPCIFDTQKELSNRQIALTYYDVESADLTKPFYVESCGLGCCMIRAEIFNKIPQPWFLPRPYTGEDISFMYEAVANHGYKILCDPTIEIGHYGIKNYTRADFMAALREDNKLLNGRVTPEVYQK